MMNKIALSLILVILSGCHNLKKSPRKQWVLDAKSSSISLITTKNDKISEVSEFKTFKGSINPLGYFSIEIDLNSLETNIPIRNQRIEKYLFQTDLFPTANIHTQLKPEDLTIGTHKITFDVDLHGISRIITGDFIVFEQHGNKVITLHKPLIINAESFSFEEGINMLKDIANLISIDFTVPINIVLTFESQ